MSCSDSDDVMSECSEAFTKKEKLEKEGQQKEEQATSATSTTSATSNPPAESDDADDSDDSDDSDDADDSADDSAEYSPGNNKTHSAPSTEAPKFEPKEPSKKEWEEHGWDYEVLGEPPNMEVSIQMIGEFKKSHKNALPGDEELCVLLGKEELTLSAKKKVYRIVLGIRNDDDKLDQAGQKGSMRSFYKEQFPKSERAKGPGVSFSVIENEQMLPVEETYVPLLRNAVKIMEERAQNCDKGHEPKAKLSAWRQRLKKAEHSLTKRRKDYEAEQKKRRNADTAKKRGKKSSESLEEEINKRVQKRNIGFKDHVETLVQGGMTYPEAIEQAMAM